MSGARHPGVDPGPPAPPGSPGTPAVPHASRPTTKRTLLVLSHTMERGFDAAAGPGAPGAGGLVLALFQRREYFDREAARYGALAAGGATVVAGFVGSLDGLPPGVHGVSLAPGDPLALQWSVVMLGPAQGSALVARDVLRLAEGELTLQASRLFDARWTFRRGPAVAHARELLGALAPALAPAVAAAARARLEAAAAVPSGAAEEQLSVVAEDLVSGLDAGHRRALRAHAALRATGSLAEWDPLTGLHNRRHLERFLGGGVADPADLALLIVDIDGLRSVNDRFGHRAGDAVVTAVARRLDDARRPGDIVVRWGGDEFLVVAPGLGTGDALDLAESLAGAVRLAHPEEPWDELPLSVSVGVCLTTRTVLPLAALDRALATVKRTRRGHAAVAPLAVAAA